MLFSWLLARGSGGQFLFRIEDTDRTRLVPDSIRSMVEDFEWLGLDIDEGPTREDLDRAGFGWEGAKGFQGGAQPYIQSLRLPRYREVAEQLVARGFAYRCDCSAERLEAEREEQTRRGEPTGYSGFCRQRNVPPSSPHVIRFLIPDGSAVRFDDAIRGTILWDPVVLKDTVILKTDGFPTYHLGATVDDHDMRITHVLRGEEWISTTPLHCMLYQALEWERPAIAHLPVILGSDGKKLSKRHGAAFCKTYREEGYLAPALLNYLLLNGWSPADGDAKEILTREEMIARFSLGRVNSAPATFSPDKLNWMNAVYMRNTPDEDLTALIAPFVSAAGFAVDRERLRRILPAIRERLTQSLKDAVPLVEFLFVDRVPFGPSEIGELKLRPEQATALLSRVRDIARETSDFTASALEEAMKSLPETLGLPKKAVFMCIRQAVTGRKVTPPLFDSIAVLGRAQTLERLDAALAAIAAG
jgi:glutamyl-tRNA synthetase